MRKDPRSIVSPELLNHRISAARSREDIETVARLFAEYVDFLSLDLSYQDFTAEVAKLPGKYAPPAGELLLARGEDGRALGCVGLRPLPAHGCCEMKRLYVVPEAHSLGLGRKLAETVISIARHRGYKEMHLDTFPTMESAIRLYENLGFERGPAYYGPTPPGTIFMRASLVDRERLERS